MIAFVYGETCAFLVEPVARDLSQAVIKAGGEATTIALGRRRPLQPDRSVDRVYVLPFDAPAERTPAETISDLFPNARVINRFGLQDLCWDKIATQERLLAKGVPVPDTLITSDPSDVFQFVRQHRFAILKDPFSCGGAGHLVVWIEGEEMFGDCGSHRYRLRLGGSGERLLVGDKLTYPEPFYVQRLVGVGRGSDAPQVLRAYIVDRQIQFWTERYREAYERPSDWIINAARGAHYRFLLDVGDDAKKIAARAADVLGIRFGAVDLVRSSSAGSYVIEVDMDSHHMFIDRGFKLMPEYRDVFDLDAHIGEAMVIFQKDEQDDDR